MDEKDRLGAKLREKEKAEEDAEEVGDLGPETVQQPAARQLGDYIRPGEG